MSFLAAYYLLLAFCLLLAIGLTVAAWRRAHRQRLALRIGAGWLAVAGLWWTAYPPTRSVPAARPAAVVLTAGYSPDTLRQLLRRLGPAARVWRYRPAPAAADTPGLSSLPALREQQSALRRLHVLGQGLPAADLPQLGALRLVSHARAPYPGFRTAQWNRQPQLGEPVILEGTFDNASAPAGAVWLYLRAAGARRDSVQLPAGHGEFRLQYQPKAAGRAVYEVQARQRGQVLATEPVPVEVRPEQPLRVLLLAASPSFEFRFLKAYLGRRQHSVALRTGISRGLTQTEFLNQPAHELGRLTAPLLARYDAVVLDAASLAALPTTENQALQSALRTTGLGVVVLADAGPLPRNAPAYADFTIVPSSSAASSAAQPVAGPAAPGRPATLVPAVLRSAPAIRPLVTNAQHAPVVASRRVGAGQVVVSVLPATYAWSLQGQTAVYETYWSRLLGTVARPRAEAARWQVMSAWPRPAAPLALRLAVVRLPGSPPSAQREAGPIVPLALQQDPQLLEWSTATYWPEAAGWHRVQLAAQAPHWFYVFAEQAWRLPEDQQRAQAAAAWQAPAREEPLAPFAHRTPWPVLWFFLLFVVGVGALWLEEKL